MNSYLFPADRDQIISNTIPPISLISCKKKANLKKYPNLLQDISSHSPILFLHKIGNICDPDESRFGGGRDYTF